MVQVGPVHVAETWHGPTGVFKDLVLHALARICSYFLQKSQKTATILVSTTGDTGGTTIHSAIGMKTLRVIVGYPRKTVSRIQELQMTTTGAKNATVFAHDGNSDDFDVTLKSIFTDPELRWKHILLSFNSIHTVRILLNIVHYVYIYLRVAPGADRNVVIAVPTGGMGNIAGGFMTAGMGVPIKLISAVNENDTVHRAFSEGEFSMKGPLVPTYAISLDSSFPYNIERVFFYASGKDCGVVKEVMETFERGEKSILPEKILQNASHLSTWRVNKTECLETMKAIWEEHGYHLCPHSAVAMASALKTVTPPTKERAGERTITVVMATATAAKFPETLGKVGVPVPSAPWVSGLQGREEEKVYLNHDDDWDSAVRECITSP